MRARPTVRQRGQEIIEDGAMKADALAGREAERPDAHAIRFRQQRLPDATVHSVGRELPPQFRGPAFHRFRRFRGHGVTPSFRLDGIIGWLEWLSSATAAKLPVRAAK